MTIAFETADDRREGRVDPSPGLEQGREEGAGPGLRHAQLDVARIGGQGPSPAIVAVGRLLLGLLGPPAPITPIASR